MAQSRQPHDQPGVASVGQGLVLLDGPDGVAIALTPHAAEATGNSLVTAAGQARNETRPSPPAKSG